MDSAKKSRKKHKHKDFIKLNQKKYQPPKVLKRAASPPLLPLRRITTNVYREEIDLTGGRTANAADKRRAFKSLASV